MTTRTQGIVLAILTGVGWGLGPIFFKLMEWQDLWGVLGLRVLIGAVVFFIVARLIPKPTSQPTVEPTQRGRLWIAGFGVGASTLLWQVAIGYTSVALTILSVYMYVPMLLLFAWFVHRRRPTLTEIGSVAVAMIGLALALNFNSFDQRILGPAAGLLAAVMIVTLLVAFGRTDDRRRFVVLAWAHLAVGGAAVFFNLVTGGTFVPLRGIDWIYLIIFALMTALPYAGYLLAARRLDGMLHVVGLLTMIEVPVAILLAWLVIGEHLTPGIALGSALILGSATVAVRNMQSA